MGKLRLTLPKKEEDIEKVMEEVYETHPEMREEHEHHHHHHHHEDELIIVLNSIVDGLNHFNTHLKNLESRMSFLEKAISYMARMNALLYKALLYGDQEDKREILKKIQDILMELEKQGKN